MKKYVKIKIFVELYCHQKRRYILELNRYMKSDKMSYIIYVDIESLIKKQVDVEIIQKILQQEK